MIRERAVLETLGRPGRLEPAHEDVVDVVTGDVLEAGGPGESAG